MHALWVTCDTDDGGSAWLVQQYTHFSDQASGVLLRNLGPSLTDRDDACIASMSEMAMQMTMYWGALWVARLLQSGPTAVDEPDRVGGMVLAHEHRSRLEASLPRVRKELQPGLCMAGGLVWCHKYHAYSCKNGDIIGLAA